MKTLVACCFAMVLICAGFLLSADYAQAWGSDCCTNVSSTDADGNYDYTFSGYVDSSGNVYGSWTYNGSNNDSGSGGGTINDSPYYSAPSLSCRIWMPGDTYPSLRPDKIINLNESLTVSADSNNDVNYWSHRGSGYAYVYLDGRQLARYYDTSRSFWGHVISGSDFTVIGDHTVRATFTGRFGSYSCTRNVEVAGTAPASVNFEIRNDTAGTDWTTDNITIDYGDQIWLKWDSEAADTCVGRYFNTNEELFGTQEDVYEPNPGGSLIYRVTCYTSDGGRIYKDITVTRQDNGPAANLEVRNITTGTAWTGSNITIDANEQIALRWDSTNADSCSGYNVTTGGGVTGLLDGVVDDVVEPLGGSSKTYAVTCEGYGYQATDGLQVTSEAGTGATLTCDKSIVHKGDDVSCTYDVGTSDPAACEIRLGNTVIPGYSTLSSATGSFTYTVIAESTFTLDCEGGANTDQKTITVLPDFQET